MIRDQVLRHLYRAEQALTNARVGLSGIDEELREQASELVHAVEELYRRVEGLT